MSDSKKYYYLKLKDNFFDQDHIKVIEAMENGYIYINILLKLYLKSLKHEGKLMMTERLPYKPEVIAKVTNHDIDHVKSAFKIFKEFDLIDVLDNKAMYMLDIQNFIGHSSSEADRKRDYRARIEQDKCPAISPDKSPPERELERELEKEKEREKEIKTTDDKPSGTDIISLYTSLLKEYSIIYKPANYEYSNFHVGYKKYIADVPHEQIEMAMKMWFSTGIGSWCGYALKQFWGDIGKIQVAPRGKNNEMKNIQEIIDG